MHSYRIYIIYSIFFLWSILSNIISISESYIISRTWQICVFILIGMAAFTFISQTHIFSNKILRFTIIWSFYVSFVNILFSGNPEHKYLETFIDINWWTTILILFYSIFIIDFQLRMSVTVIPLIEKPVKVLAGNFFEC